MEIYLLESPTTPWGDWGEILWSGLTSYDETTGQYLIDRVGPYTPQAFFSCGHLVVTEKIKILLEASDLKGIVFTKKIKKRKTVRIDWLNWDRTRHITNYLDELTEPEDIIYERDNDKELGVSMPNYWLADISEKIHTFTDRTSKSIDPSEYLFIDSTTSVDCDFYQGIERRGYYITPKAKSWLDSNCTECFITHLSWLH